MIVFIGCLFCVLNAVAAAVGFVHGNYGASLFNLIVAAALLHSLLRYSA